MQSCWRHSVACAIIAERSAKWRFLDRDFAYTAGILHDIGRVALATIMPGAYARVIERGADGPQDILQNEREFCGIDHCQAGRLLGTVWNLPEAFLAITACHHDRGAHLPVAASLIAPSCVLADSLGFAVIRCRSSRSYAEILAEFPEPARNRFPAEAEELVSDIANEIKVMESVSGDAAP
jgi:HD-like signal output (HDOD) protein